jgi:FkbM family methyltransferase
MKGKVKELMRRLSYRLGHHNLDPLTFLLNTRLQKKGELFIVQIGANDGTTYDPIHDFVMRNKGRVKALMLEPVSDFYNQLVATYRDHPGVTPLRLAIHKSEKSMEIHRVDPARLSSAPEFVKGIASFDAHYHAKSKTPPEWIITERVECVTLHELLDRYGVQKIDLLCMDTEGYDAEILSSIDFEKVQPVILMFEHGLRDGVMSEESLAKIVMRLNRYGYDVLVQDYDVVAHLRDRLAH